MFILERIQQSYKLRLRQDYANATPFRFRHPPLISHGGELDVWRSMPGDIGDKIVRFQHSSKTFRGGGCRLKTPIPSRMFAKDLKVSLRHWRQFMRGRRERLCLTKPPLSCISFSFRLLAAGKCLLYSQRERSQYFQDSAGVGAGKSGNHFRPSNPSSSIIKTG